MSYEKHKQLESLLYTLERGYLVALLLNQLKAKHNYDVMAIQTEVNEILVIIEQLEREFNG